LLKRNVRNKSIAYKIGLSKIGEKFRRALITRISRQDG
jgi:FixJ family two-component response regulator